MRRLIRSSATAAAQQQRWLSYKVRQREYQFIFEEVLHMYDHYKQIGVGETATKELVDSIIEESAKICTSTLFPLYESGDQEGGCVLKDGHVTTPKGFKEAYKQYIEGGWTGMTLPEAVGGQGLPSSIGFVQKEIMATANWAFFMYPGLSSGAMSTLLKHGNDEQKEKYLSKLVSGEWSGTMCLTEPHCGTDLGQVKTKAVPAEDGTYRITGTKIFISAGEHDMTDNILHIVLAKLPDAAEGTKGISLFLVPRNIVNADGTLSKEKNVKCIAIEKKMGIKANATAQLAFENSVGYMIGGPGDGMKQMFTFMNVARIGTAVQGVAHAELAFQNALNYARDRYSMRALSGTKNPDKPADSILHHAGVKHQVLFCKAIAEAGRAFVTDMARLQDLIETAKSPEEAKKFDAELGVMTPIAKGFLTEMGVEAAYNAQQTYGGHGFIAGNGVEQIARDARIATLYEGTTGVQGLDLIGRKVLLSKVNHYGALQSKIASLAKSHALGTGSINRNARKLYTMNLKAKMAIGAVMLNAARNKEAVGSSATDFLMMSGYVVLGYYWLRIAVAAQKKVDAGQDPDGFYATKVQVCDFYFKRILPRASGHLEILASTPEYMEIKNETLDLA
jgi:alkylation response protein AidB-like acyl-CoA dehydrogenase